MKHLKRILILAIIFGIAMVISEMNISYGGVSINASKTTVYPGDQFTVTVNSSGAAAWNVHVSVEGPVSGGGIKLVGDSSDGNNTSASNSATYTATGIGTIRFYASGDITINQGRDENTGKIIGENQNVSVSATVNVVERPAPEPEPKSNTSKQSTNTTKTNTTTKKQTTTPAEEHPNEESGEEDLLAAKIVIDLIDALDNTLESFASDVVAAREAYEALTDAQKELVTNYEELLLAEEELKEETEKEPEEIKEEEKKEPIMVSISLAKFILLQAGIIILEAGLIIGLSKYIGKRKK